MGVPVAFVFPGQGAQEVGMGRDLFGRDETADALAEAVSQAMSTDIAKVSTRGPARALTQTEVLQPALTVVCLALLNRLREGGLKPLVSAGHSVGELSALVSAGAAEPRAMVEVAAMRGRLMGDAAAKARGGMMAVTGLDLETVREELSPFESRGVICVGAVNAPTQVTVSGDKDLIDEFFESLRGGADAKPTKLRVSGAWHSRHMQGAVEPLRETLNKVEWKSGEVPMLFNRDGQGGRTKAEIPNLIADQLIHPVRWDLVMKKILDTGIKDIVEIGPGKVLRGLVRLNTQDPEIRVHAVSDVRSSENVMRALSV